MEGIQYVTDDQNRRVAVLLDLNRHGELWEEICDVLTATARQHEPVHSWQQVREEMMRPDQPQQL